MIQMENDPNSINSCHSNALSPLCHLFHLLLSFTSPSAAHFLLDGACCITLDVQMHLLSRRTFVCLSVCLLTFHTVCLLLKRKANWWEGKEFFFCFLFLKAIFLWDCEVDFFFLLPILNEFDVSCPERMLHPSTQVFAAQVSLKSLLFS